MVVSTFPDLERSAERAETLVEVRPALDAMGAARLLTLLYEAFRSAVDVDLGDRSGDALQFHVHVEPSLVLEGLRRNAARLPELPITVWRSGLSTVQVRVTPALVEHETSAAVGAGDTNDASAGALRPAAAGTAEAAAAQAPAQGDGGAHAVGAWDGAQSAAAAADAAAPPWPERRAQTVAVEVLRAQSGVLSWEAFIVFASAATAHARRRRGSLALILVTLDPLPALPAFAGAQLEEAALHGLATVLLRTIRSADVVAHYGPRSFAVLAQDAQQAGAWRLAERVQAALPDQIGGLGAGAPYTISIGIATLPEAGTTVPELLCHAEEALSEAAFEEGNQARMCRASALGTGTWLERETRTEQRPLPVRRADQGRLAAERNEVLQQAVAAYQRGEVEGIAIKTDAGACPACLDAARDLYVPRLVPALPLQACTTAGGCRCTYALPAADPRRRPPPVRALAQGTLEIPRALRAAALYGSDPKGSATVEDVASYLDRFPLLPFESDLKLQQGEVVYLMRPARSGVESEGKRGQAAVHGPLFPPGDPFLPWVQTLGKLPSLPGGAAERKDDGVFYLTNWRLVFSRGDASESLLLADLSGVECYRDAIACTRSDGGRRSFFVMKDAPQVGLYVAQALRDVIAVMDV